MEWFGVAFPSMKESYIPRVPSRIWLSFIQQEESTMPKVYHPAFFIQKIKASWRESQDSWRKSRASFRKSLAARRKSLQSFFKTGDWLIEAKDKLEHGAFTAMIRNDLPFKARKAQMLMAVATDKRLQNANHGSLLPPHWRTLYKLTKLDDVAFDKAIVSGTIHPEMQRRDAEALLPPPQSSIPVFRQLSQPSDSRDVPLTVRVLANTASRPPARIRVGAMVAAAPAPAPPKMKSVEDSPLPKPTDLTYLPGQTRRVCGESRPTRHQSGA
jgi:hypothetical protein